MKILENMTLEEVRNLRSSLSIYALMKKQLGKRWKELFYRQITGKKKYVVEYFPTLGEDEAWEQAQTVFSKSFWETPTKQEVIFTENPGMKWWMRVYQDDNMIDMSYQKVENILQK